MKKFFGVAMYCGTIIVVFGVMISLFGTLIYVSSGPYTKGRFHLPHKDVSEVDSSLEGYLTVEDGEKFWFPVKEFDSEKEMYEFRDYFEVVSILGDPNDTSSELTNFAEDDIWLLVRSFQTNYPQFFILQVKNLLQLGNTEILDSLSELFMQGEFFSDSGVPKVKSTGVYLYIQRIEITIEGRFEEKKYPAFRDRVLCEVNSAKDHLIVQAKTFNSEEQGQLVVLVDCDKSLLVESRWDRDRGRVTDFYRFYVVFVGQEAVKNRPELQGVLPSTSGVWTDEEPLIDWDSIEDDAESSE